MFAANNGKSQQQNRRNANGNRSKQPARHAERTLQFRFANAQANERNKLKRQARAVDHDVKRDQPFEAKIQSQSPANRQRQNRNPASARFWTPPPPKILQHALLTLLSP